MPNMSYCRFHNTVIDLADCRDAMQGADEYYQSPGDLSAEEREYMTRLIELCREIITIEERGGNVFQEGNS